MVFLLHFVQVSHLVCMQIVLGGSVSYKSA